MNSNEGDLKQNFQNIHVLPYHKLLSYTESSQLALGSAKTTVQACDRNKQ
jgi:hypothetical protein